MSLRRGIVVAVHPEDHSVDLVMADDGQRLIGVQVLTPNGSTRSGRVDLPAVPEKADKWDVTKQTGQDQFAMVAYLGSNPVVIGFMYPQINQMLHKDPKLMIDRHQSDVMTMIDGDGNFQWTHPSGTYIRIGENPDKVDPANKNADSSLAVDRNTGKQVSVRIGMAGGAAVVTIAPSGAISITSKATLGIQTDGAVSVKCSAATVDTPTAHFTGNVNVDGDVVASGISLVSHTHTGVIPGGARTGPP